MSTGIKRTYGKKAPLATTTPEQTNDSSRPSSPIPLFRSSSTESLALTPPTSPITHKIEESPPRRSPGKENATPKSKPKKRSKPLVSTSLFNFFNPVSPPKRVRSTELDLKATKKRKLALQSTTRAKFVKKGVKGGEKKNRLEQLYLDLYETGGHVTSSCATCGLTYAQTPGDAEFHNKHHAQVMGGIEWFKKDPKDVRVVKEIPGEGKIVAVDTSLKGNIGVKVLDLLVTVDKVLSASGIGPVAMKSATAYMLINLDNKIVSCALVQRIKQAYRVQPSLSSKSASEKNSLVRIGEDKGALFCLPKKYPAEIGVHRIWSTNNHRRRGYASMLLDAVAEGYIYGCPVLKEQRKEMFAFTQPTASGMALARSWTGTNEFKVFEEEEAGSES